MNKSCPVTRFLLTGLACCLICPLTVMLTGCDADPVEDFAVSITPQTATLRENESVVFTASGAVRYTWSTSTNSEVSTNTTTTTTEVDPWMLLSATTGDQITYTSLRSPEDADYVVQVLTVTGTLGSQSTVSGTNTTTSARTATATAYIYHVR